MDGMRELIVNWKSSGKGRGIQPALGTGGRQIPHREQMWRRAELRQQGGSRARPAQPRVGRAGIPSWVGDALDVFLKGFCLYFKTSLSVIAKKNH